jgi:hypothetical protein
MRIAILIMSIGLGACRATVPTPAAEAEHVGTLVPSYASIAPPAPRKAAEPVLEAKMVSKETAPVETAKAAEEEAPAVVEKQAHGF